MSDFFSSDLDRNAGEASVCDNCLRDGGMFSLERRGRFRSFRVNTDEAAAIRDALLADPERLMADGDVFKPGSRGFAVGVKIGGRSYFLKAYDCLGWGYRLRNALRRSRALHTWTVTWGFYLRGLPVPRPLLCLEERRWRLLGRSYLVTEVVSGAINLAQAWSRNGRRDKIELLSRVGFLMGKMHRMNCSHGDMKWNNILVLPGQTDPEVVFVDTDSARIASRPPSRRIRKDIDRFLRDLRKNEKDPFFSELFRKNWSKAFDGA
jgi:tRNA A-37 threonylcarbamoyl transferase component Bud32